MLSIWTSDLNVVWYIELERTFLLHDKNLHMLISKVGTDNKSKVHIVEFHFNRSEKLLTKGENAGY